MLKVLLASVVLLVAVSPAWAEEDLPPQPAPVENEMAAAPQTPAIAPAGDLVPPQTATIEGELPAGKYPILRLTPDKIEVVRLDRDATEVLVGNSVHLVGVLETPRQVLLIPRQPGASNFQALDERGNVIMERAIIVASPKQDYVRVRRTCATKDSGACKEFSVFYCPDMCHEIAVPQEIKTGGTTIPDKTASADSSSSDLTTNDGMTDEAAQGTGSVAGTIGSVAAP